MEPLKESRRASLETLRVRATNAARTRALDRMEELETELVETKEKLQTLLSPPYQKISKSQKWVVLEYRTTLSKAAWDKLVSLLKPKVASLPLFHPFPFPILSPAPH